MKIQINDEANEIIFEVNDEIHDKHYVKMIVTNMNDHTDSFEFWITKEQLKSIALLFTFAKERV